MACGVLWMIAAALRQALGAPESAGFTAILATPFLVAARWSAHVSPHWGWALALGVLLLGALWHFVAPYLKRRGGDAIFSALLVLEIFWIFRWYNSRLAPAGAPTWGDLSHAQQASLALGVLLIACLIGAWLLLPAARASYENAAPSRVTSFMKKKRMPARIAGAASMALAIFLIAFSAFHLSENLARPALFGLVAAPVLFGLWVALDAVYVVGRKMWRRLT